MMILLLVAIVWVLGTGFALTLFAAAGNADRQAEAMLDEHRLPRRRSRRIAA